MIKVPGRTIIASNLGHYDLGKENCSGIVNGKVPFCEFEDKGVLFSSRLNTAQPSGLS